MEAPRLSCLDYLVLIGAPMSGVAEVLPYLVLSQSVAIEEETAIKQTLAGYYRAFSTLEANAAVEYFHEPTVLMNPQGVFAAATRPELAAVFTPVMEGLRNQGYGGSELSIQQITALGNAAYSVTGIAIRRKLDGSELQRVNLTYILHRTEGDWAIAVMVMHGKD